MWEYQDDIGIPYLQAHPRCGLFDEQGLGKTRQLLAAARGQTLVLAPAMAIAAGVWDDEIALWAPDADITQVPYSSVMERTRGPRGGSVPTSRLIPDLRRHWSTVICDESHYLKGRKSKWTEAVMKLRADRFYLATGTPIPNWAYELFTHCQLLFPQEAGPGGRFGSYWRWAREWFHVGPTHWSPMEVGKPHDGTPEGWHRFNSENLGDRYLLRTWEEVLPNLPPMREQKIECPMSAAQAKAYRELKKDYVTWTESGEEVAAWSAAGREVKLAKCATSLRLLDQSAKPDGKLAMFSEVMAPRSNEQVFVVAHFRSTVAALATEVREVLGRSVETVDGSMTPAQRAGPVRAFKDGKLQVLIGTIDTVAESLNFPNVHTVIRVERSWRPSKNKQAARRIRRASNLSPKLCIDLVTPKTVDAKMLPILKAKTDQQVSALRPGEIARLL